MTNTPDPAAIASHTPGPWHVEPVTNEDGDQFWSDDWNGKVWCVCHPQTECDATTVVEWINEADARLIAAAPDLLEALQELVGEELCGDRNPDNAKRETDFYRPVFSWAMRHRARAAIAKATGAVRAELEKRR